MLGSSSVRAVQGMRNFQFRFALADFRRLLVPMVFRFRCKRRPTQGPRGNRSSATGLTTRLRPAIAAMMLVALNALALTACAHGADAQEVPVTQQERPDAAASEAYTPTTPAEHPELTPEEVGNRVLRLLDGLESVDALAVEPVKAKTGLPLKYAPRGKAYAFTVEMPDSPWYYSVSLRQSRTGNYVLLDYTYTGDVAPAGEPLCGLQFDAVERKLKGDGYLMRIDIDGLGRPLAYTFHRARVVVQIVLGPSVPGTEPGSRRACVGQLMITSAD